MIKLLSTEGDYGPAGHTHTHKHILHTHHPFIHSDSSSNEACMQIHRKQSGPNSEVFPSFVLSIMFTLPHKAKSKSAVLEWCTRLKIFTKMNSGGKTL